MTTLVGRHSLRPTTHHPVPTAHSSGTSNLNLAPAAAADAIAAMRAAGIMVDPEVALTWLSSAVEVTRAPGEFVASDEGYSGHELALLDFDPTTVERWRRLGQILSIPPANGVQVATAISGSSAQSRIQPYPADIDYFERLHFLTPTRDAALHRLAESVRTNAGQSDRPSRVILEDVRFGLAPPNASNEEPPNERRSLLWSPRDVESGCLTTTAADGSAGLVVTWDSVAPEPGLVKLSWFVADEELGGPIWVSKVIDATWQGPDGSVVPLDGQLDRELQQIYLTPTGAELAEYLTGFITEADRHRYLVAMRRDVKIYATMSPPNFGKVAKRLYNVCRLTGRFAEALYLREMFDEPMAMLYQARSPLEAIRRACASDPVSACTALTATLSDLTPLLAHDPVAETTFAKCWRVVHCPDEASVSAATEELGALIADHTNHLFRRGLFAFAPIAALLMECGVGNAGG